MACGDYLDRMSKPFTSGDDGLARKGYHHGNLREALIEAARFLITERGPQGFTLIEAARLVNVSPAAPYRHFKDRDALVSEVAAIAAETFERRMRIAGETAVTPQARMEAFGGAYLAFAREEPGLYRALFDTPCTLSRPTLIFKALEASIKDLRPDHPDPGGAAQAVWALSHGVALLVQSGQWPASGKTPDDVLSLGARSLLG